MSLPVRDRWIRTMLLVAAIYVVVGVVTADVAWFQGGTGWRLAAWVVSLVVFLAHVAHEQRRARVSARVGATHAATAVALGTLVLAAVGPVRSHWAAPDFWRVAALSLPLWPILAGVPAWTVAWVVGAILARLAPPAAPRG